jgi:hypothetical protein
MTTAWYYWSLRSLPDGEGVFAFFLLFSWLHKMNPFKNFKSRDPYVRSKYDKEICGVRGSDLLRSDTKMADRFRVTADR